MKPSGRDTAKDLGFWEKRKLQLKLNNEDDRITSLCEGRTRCLLYTREFQTVFEFYKMMHFLTTWTPVSFVRRIYLVSRRNQLYFEQT